MDQVWDYVKHILDFKSISPGVDLFLWPKYLKQFPDSVSINGISIFACFGKAVWNNLYRFQNFVQCCLFDNTLHLAILEYYAQVRMIKACEAK